MILACGMESYRLLYKLHLFNIRKKSFDKYKILVKIRYLQLDFENQKVSKEFAILKDKKVQKLCYNEYN